ncbi:hypothetical protein RB195_013803 [Necator americanus]|uniref:PiggyBac transposable element-derived protein domain-containing protein n=1 Tax=Necator americanus TaxID=51031 RepID=A0ABR1DXG4_NECAM
METRNSRSLRLYARRGNHLTESITMKLTTSSSVKGFARRMSLLYQSFIRDRTIASFEEDFVLHGEEKTKQTPKSIIDWVLFASFVGFWKDAVTYNIDDEWLAEHDVHDRTRKAKSFKTSKRCLYPKPLEPIRECGAARDAGTQELTSELARLCREAIKGDLKEREEQ